MFLVSESTLTFLEQCSLFLKVISLFSSRVPFFLEYSNFSGTAFLFSESTLTSLELYSLFLRVLLRLNLFVNYSLLDTVYYITTLSIVVQCSLL